MKTIKIKPMSVNLVWQGQRYKTQAYKNYEQELFYILPKIKIPKGKLQIKLIFGFTRKVSDIDNPVKPFIDVLQKRYTFNDRNIYRLEVEKKEVKKGEEFISFELKKFSEKETQKEYIPFKGKIK